MTMKKRLIKKIERKFIYKNPWITVYEDDVYHPDGSKGIYGIVVQSGGVGIIAKNKKGDIYLVKEYGYAIQNDILNLPGGHLKKGLTPLQNAKAELYEETGLRAKKWTPLGWYYTDYGLGPAKEYAFLAEDLDESDIAIHQDGNEAINKVVKVKETELKKLVRDGKIRGSFSLSCLAYYFNRDVR